MKILLNNGTELKITTLNRSFGNISGGNTESVIIAFSKSCDVEDVAKVFTNETISKFTLIREGVSDKVYEGYTIQSITENNNDEKTEITAFLVK